MAKKITKTKAKKAAKAAKKHPVAAIIIVAILLVVIAVAVVLYFAKPNLYHEYLGVGKHTYSEWETTSPTCTADGQMKRYCTVCGEEEIETVPKLPGEGAHTFTEWVTDKENDCGNAGKQSRTCTGCGEKETQTIPATGNHDYGDWETTDATCGKDGKKERVCSVCEYKQTQTIPATGNHDYGDWDITDPVCGEDGEKVRTCAVCGHEESEVIPAQSEHSYSDWVIDKEATCGEVGTRTRVCSSCNHEDTEDIPATGNHTMGANNVCTVCGYSTNAATEFSIHFLELGNASAGDCILIDCGDTEVLIDAGSQQSSATTIKQYLKQYCTDGTLEYVISTHADSDHISGFVGTSNNGVYNGILYSYNVGTFIKFDRTNKNTQIYNKYLTAIDYAKAKDDGTKTKVYTASQCYEEKDGAQRQYYLDEAHTVSINILYNYYYYNSSGDENNYSVVTLLTQELAGGNKHYLFTGDLELSGESKMVDYYANPANSRSEFDILPKVEIYKAGHHGSNTSSTEKLLNVIQPKNVVVCCCAGSPEYTTNNDNTFPTQAMIDNVGKYTDKIYVTTLATNVAEVVNGVITSQKGYGYTSMNGDIVFTAKGDKLELWCSNNYTILKETEWFKNNRTWNVV